MILSKSAVPIGDYGKTACLIRYDSRHPSRLTLYSPHFDGNQEEPYNPAISYTLQGDSEIIELRDFLIENTKGGG